MSRGLGDVYKRQEHELGLVSEDAMEAFDAEDEQIKVAHLARIKPTTRLMGEEE